MMQHENGMDHMEPVPRGAGGASVPRALIADGLTSEQLVRSDEADALFFRALEGSGMYLNEAQIAAVRAVDGQVLINAGAGSGKTTVLTCRAAYLLLVRRVPPENIVLVTFTRQAARQMQERLRSIAGVTDGMVRRMITGTFHSLARTIYFHKLTEQPRMMSQKQKEYVLSQLTKEMATGEQYEPETLLALLAYLKNNLYVVGSEWNTRDVDGLKEDARRVLMRYEAYKRENNLIDYEDLITGCIETLAAHPTYREALQRRMTYIMVDEYQDTNIAQYEMIRQLSERASLCVVGDPDQAIYGWRGADPSIMLRFPQEYPNCTCITLDINYRSPAGVVGLGNAVIRHNEDRFEKELKVLPGAPGLPMYMTARSAEHEAECVLALITRLVESGEYAYPDIAVLYRTHSTARTLYEKLLLSDVPFTTHRDEPTFYERGTIRPVLDFLRLSVEPYSEQALSSILPCLYISRARYEKEIHVTAIQQGISYLEAIGHLEGLPAYQKRKLQERATWLASIARISPLQAIKEVRNDAGGGYDRFLGSEQDGAVTYHKEIIRDDLLELEEAARRFATVPEFLTYIDTIVAEKELHRKRQREQVALAGVTLQTVHAAKGLEYPVVIVLGAIDGVMPHSIAVDPDEKADFWLHKKTDVRWQEAVEEERRLAYVAVTRAKRDLYVSSPLYFRGRPAATSPFLLEAFTGRSHIASPATKEETKR
ncbi:Rep family ATP-dependent DNA helicase [Aneurinibacillus soli]|uniref:DNA 3'-5' helicase n=1 Tax=Aneurinibacillus soli TaxID=1500254 RepID=A0A0U5B036_9BACL|nr:ATP-dependent helicase [Aneurinibacillus soli]PYE58206.1 Rep family ATP-dependent DNA helicase [Aneurinibacillus soli]BAU27922.1 putative ATP-dependent DNA helicase YjcD [Aneurinibacillus soli]